jgi:hypothetical protein
MTRRTGLVVKGQPCLSSNLRLHRAACSAATRTAASLGTYGALRNSAWNRPSIPAEDFASPIDEPPSSDPSQSHVFAIEQAEALPPLYGTDTCAVGT